MLDLLKKWWEGEYVPPKNDPNSGVFIIRGSTRWHWSARLARWCIDFYGREWKWVLGSVAAVVGAFILKK